MSVRRLLSSIVGLAAFGTFATVTSDSFAEHKVYHGTSCVQRNDTTPQIRYGFTGAVNNGADAKYWICPAVRERQSSDVTDWDVNVHRHNAVAAWDIGLYSCNREGDTCYWDIVTVPANPANDTIYLDGDDVGSFYSQGSLYVYSLIPGNAQIHSYHVVESD